MIKKTPKSYPSLYRMTTTQTSDGACDTSRTKSDPEMGITDPNLNTFAASCISASLFFLSQKNDSIKNKYN